MTITVNYVTYVEDVIEVDDKYQAAAMPDEDFFSMSDERRAEWQELINEMDKEIKEKTGADRVHSVFDDTGFCIYEN